MRLRLMTMVLLLATSSVAPAQVGLSSTPVGFGTQRDANCLAVADINGDGHLDVVLGESGGGSLWLNDGKGTLTQSSWSPPMSITILSLAVGDIDHDGDVDLVAGTTLYNLLFENDAGVLSDAPAWTATGGTGRSTASNGIGLGDLDGDGDLDIVCANGYLSTNYGLVNQAYRNDGGVFPAEPTWSQDALDAAVSTSVTLADINGDGRVDAVFGNQDGPNRLYLGSASGLLDAAPSWEDMEALPTQGVVLGDISGDGILDLVCANRNVHATLHPGNGIAFSDTASWTSSRLGTDASVTLGDVDLDGDLDVAFARSDSNYVYLNGGGVLSSTPQWRSGDRRPTSGVKFADLDGDGDLELIRSGGYSETVPAGAFYRNTNSQYSPTPGWESEAPRGARDVELVDIDLDGDLDLFLSHYQNRNYLYKYSGAGLSATPDWSTPYSGITNDAAFADMDGDGDPDLLCGQNGISTIYRNEGGTLSADSVWSIDNGGEVVAVTWGDFWLDGYPDPAFGIGPDGPMHIAANLGSGVPVRVTGSSASWRGPSRALGLLAIDSGNSGRVDLLATSAFNIYAYFGVPGGGLRDTQVYIADGFYRHFEVMYIDRDDRPDLLTSAPISGWTPTGAAYLNRDGLQNVTEVWELGTSSGDLVHEARDGDIDGDGWVDIVTVAPDGAEARIRVYGNSGNSSFTLVSSVRINKPGLRYMKLGDIDADGDIDIATAVGGERGTPGGSQGTAAVFFSRRCPVFKGSYTSPSNQLPGSSAGLRNVTAVPLSDNQWEVSFSLYDVDSDPVAVTLEYQYEGEGIWRPMQLGNPTTRVYASSPQGVSHTVVWDITEIELNRHPVTIRAQATDVTASVGLSSQHVSRFLKSVGGVVPRKPSLSVVSPMAAFPTVTVGDTVLSSVEIKNTGNEPLSVTGVQFPLSGMRLLSGGEGALAGGELDTLLLEFAPRSKPPVAGDIEIVSNDPVHPSVPVPVSVDVRGLSMTTTMVASPGPLPIEDAVSILVHPLESPRVEHGWILHRPAGQEAFLDSVVLNPFGNGDYVGVIPDAALFESGLEYYVRLENSGVNGYDPPGAPNDIYSREVAPPTTVSAEAFPNDGQRYGQGRPIRVQATLPPGSEFQQGWVYYRAGATARYDTLAMVGDGATAECDLPGEVADVRGVEYWLEVKTFGAPRLTAPATDPQSRPYVIRTTLAHVNDPVSHPGERYRLISFPADVEGGPLGALSDDLGSQEDWRWRLFAHSGGTDYAPVGQVRRFEQGRAYWLITKDAYRLDTAPVQALSTDTGTPFEMALAPGWNLVGNPFPFDVAWSDVIRDTLAVPDPPQRYTGQGNNYADATILAPFSGYWVLNDADSVLSVWIPPIEHTGTGAPAPAVPLTWGVEVTAAGADDTRGLLRLGCSERAKDARDGLDRLLPPPAPESVLDLYAVGEGGRWLTRDARAQSFAAGWGHAWSFDVAVAKNGRVPVSLRFAFDAVPEGSEAMLLDREVERTHGVSDGTTVEVYVTGSARKTSAENTRFVLLVGDAQYIEEHRSLLPGLPTKTALHQNFPNPFNPTTVIRYELSRPGRVTLKIYDVRGALIRTLVDGDKAAGRYEVGWDGVDNRGSRVASGIYFYRLAASREVVLTRKMVLLK